MKYFKFILFSAVFAMAISACGGSAEQGADADATEQQEGTDAAAETTDAAAETAPASHGEGAEYTSAYVCPMHCEGSGSDEAGKCPACGMDYVAQAEHVGDGHTH